MGADQRQKLARDKIAVDTPLMFEGSEKYDEEESIEKITLIMAYNKLGCGSQLKYQPKMKPLDKEGHNKGKFRELTTAQLKTCSDRADIIVKSITDEERAQADKLQAAAEKERIERRAAVENAREAKKAPDITKDTDVQGIYLDAFHVNSSDIDDDIARMVILSFLGGREISGDGLPLKLTAETGLGKSYSVNAALYALPQTAFYSGAFSDRALLYDPSIIPGIIIKLDEAQSKSEAFESLVKEAVSSYQTGVTYRTVIDKQTVVKQLPPRLTFIMLSADSWGDEQTVSRFVPLGLSDRTGKKSQLTKFRLEKRKNAVPKLYVDKVVIKAREVLQHFSEHTFRVKIPFTDNIGYNTEDMRVQEWFESAILYSAVLNYKSRKNEIDDDGTIIVEADKKDFDYCCNLGIFKSVRKIEHRFTQPEIDIISALKNKGYEGKDILRSKLVEISGKSDSRISQILNGRQDRDKNGLMAKVGITEISISENIEQIDDIDGFSEKRTNQKAYRIPLLPDVRAGIVDNPVARWIESPD